MWSGRRGKDGGRCDGGGGVRKRGGGEREEDRDATEGVVKEGEGKGKK